MRRADHLAETKFMEGQIITIPREQASWPKSPDPTSTINLDGHPGPYFRDRTTDGAEIMARVSALPVKLPHRESPPESAPHVRVSVVGIGCQVFLDEASADPPLECERRADLVVCA